MPLSPAEFGELITEHGPALYRLGFRLTGDSADAEDLVQETFRSVWKSRAHFDPTRGTRAWLTTILRRRLADICRKRTIPFVLAADTTLETAAPLEDPAAEGFSDEMQRALERLPLELRETLLLVVVGELTHQEAAEVLGVPLGTVLSRVARARSRLREYLGTAAAKDTQQDAS